MKKIKLLLVFFIIFAFSVKAYAAYPQTLNVKIKKTTKSNFIIFNI